MALKKRRPCSVCKELMKFETRTEGDTTFGRHKCKKCNFKEGWRPIITRGEEARE